ncbi:RHS repeat-associated core domain-containing protein [Paucibacter sp. R3-3]|uniref:RHS repeat-associated core domain-containing protein n=1 Tax=Roseateles agri TaxID=3098619 RepID=A0ABU5DCB8_9BURK|nr:RHS repeat-associated core domain-containing protein [Paucibacter sp. R3-3]MDY0743343.1 RHS repeat-associated core domain-containing protein [Paucibacter sp. R3-3]
MNARGGFALPLMRFARQVAAAVVLIPTVLTLQPAQAQAPANVYSYSRTTALSYLPAGSAKAGLLASETTEPGAGKADLCSTTTYGYDSFGNRTSATTTSCAGVSPAANFASRGSTVAYDSQGQFPTSATNPLSQTETASFDARFGAKTSSTTPDGLTVTWTLDAFGRRTKELRVDHTSTLTAYCVIGAGLDLSSNSSIQNGDPLSCPSVASPGTADVPADAASFVHSEPRDVLGRKMGAFVRVYRDRLGREIRSVTESFDGSAQPSSYRGALIATDTVYNRYGAVSLQTQPYFIATRSSTTSGNGDVGVTATTYDALGRQTAIYRTDSHGSVQAGSQNAVDFGPYGGTGRQAAVVTIAYAGTTTTTTNDHEQIRVEEHNAIGELIRATDPLGAQIAYQHDAFGNLLFTRDALNNVIAVSYDIRGHKVALADPDAGTSAYCYDALGQLVAQQNAKMRGASSPACPTNPNNGSTLANAVANWTTMAYDPVGRLVHRIEAEYASNWYYDKNKDGSYCMSGTAPMRGAGRLCQSTTSTGVGKKFSYDSLGRSQSSRTDLGNGPSFANAVGYDRQTGRLATRTYPSGLQVGYSYTGLGFVQEMDLLTAATVNPLPATGSNSGASTGQAQGIALAAGSLLWQAQSANAWGGIEQQLYGNNVITNKTFEATQNRQITLTAGLNGANAAVANQSYVWDSLGNLSSRSDGNGDTSSGGVSSGAVTEAFSYDALNRLSGYQVAASQIAGLSRSVLLQYNALGLLLYKSDVGNYSYSAQGGAHPHALAGVAGAVTSTYTYDANGNMVTASGGKYAGLAYTSFNLPDAQTGITGRAGSLPSYTWQYDENHQRIREIRANAGGTRIIYYQHPDNQGALGFESEVEVNATTSNRHFLSVSGQTIGVLVSTGALPVLDVAQAAPEPLDSIVLVKLEYWHTDNLGSLISTTDHAGAVTERYAYDPFGKRRYVNGNYDADGQVQADWSYTANWGAGRGFTGHEQLDDVGLVHMNGRIFDPALGLFLQVDPMVQSPGNLQNYNRYAYCLNNPLNCTDPSGYAGVDHLDEVTVTGTRTYDISGLTALIYMNISPDILRSLSDIESAVILVTKRPSAWPKRSAQASSQAAICGTSCATIGGPAAKGAVETVVDGAVDFWSVVKRGWDQSISSTDSLKDTLIDKVLPALPESAAVGPLVKFGKATEAEMEAARLASGMERTAAQEALAVERTSASQMQKAVERGQAPKAVDRVDKAHPQPGAKDHVHFKDGTSINYDGTPHDAHNGVPNITNKIQQWLESHGWTRRSE